MTFTFALPPDSAEKRACCCLNSWIVSIVSFIVTRESPWPFMAMPSAVYVLASPGDPLNEYAPPNIWKYEFAAPVRVAAPASSAFSAMKLRPLSGSSTIRLLSMMVPMSEVDVSTRGTSPTTVAVSLMPPTCRTRSTRTR